MWTGLTGLDEAFTSCDYEFCALICETMCNTLHAYLPLFETSMKNLMKSSSSLTCTGLSINFRITELSLANSLQILFTDSRFQAANGHPLLGPSSGSSRPTLLNSFKTYIWDTDSFPYTVSNSSMSLCSCPPPQPQEWTKFDVHLLWMKWLGYNFLSPNLWWS